MNSGYSFNQNHTLPNSLQNGTVSNNKTFAIATFDTCHFLSPEIILGKPRFQESNTFLKDVSGIII